MITTNNIIEVIEKYTGRGKVALEMITKSNGDDFQVWERDANGFPYGLVKDLPFDSGDYISYMYDDANFDGLYVNDLIIFLRNDKLDKILGI